MLRGPAIKVPHITIDGASSPATAEADKTIAGATPQPWTSPAAAHQEFDSHLPPPASPRSIMDEIVATEIRPKLLRSSSGFPLRSGATADRPLRSKTFHNDFHHRFEAQSLPLAHLNLLASSHRANRSDPQDRDHNGEGPTGRDDESSKSKTKFDAGHGISTSHGPSSVSIGQEKPTQGLLIVTPQDQPRGSGDGDGDQANKQNLVSIANAGPARKHTISDRAKGVGNSTQGLVPFFQWPAKLANVQETVSARSSPRLSPPTVTNDQWKLNDTQNSIADNATSNLCRIDDYIRTGKYFEANHLPVAPDEYAKIEERRRSDVLDLLKSEQATAARIDCDANQEAARGFLESKNQLFLSVQGFLECFVHADKDDTKLVKKVWGITYCICALPLKEVSIRRSNACYSANTVLRRNLYPFYSNTRRHLYNMPLKRWKGLSRNASNF